MACLSDGRPLREASRGTVETARSPLPSPSCDPLSDLSVPSTSSASYSAHNPAVAPVAPNGESKLLGRVAGLLSGWSAVMGATGLYFMFSGSPLYGGSFAAGAAAALICARQISRIATEWGRSPADM